MKICLIEDDAIMGETLAERLDLEGFACRWLRSGAQALALDPGEPVDLFISDVRLPDINGADLFTRVSAQRPHAPWIFITGYGTLAQRDALMAAGAADFFTKPLDMDRLMRRLRAIAAQPAQPPSPAGREPPCPLGVSSEMRRLYALTGRLGAHWDTVLVTGESGAGKEELARCLHARTAGDDAPFVAINTASLPESLIEAELFGYERGAFTGAQRQHRGKFEQAEGGTLFLDEIGDMPPGVQVRLLRVLQDRRVTRLGGDREMPLRVRMVFATHRNLNDEVRAGRFREDLYYRINVVHLRVPALRDRPEDIPWLAERFLREWNGAHPDSPKRLGDDAEAVMLRHAWPGNVRELRNAIERACLLSAGERVDSALLVESEVASPPRGLHAPGGTLEPTPTRLDEFLRAQERAFIRQALERSSWQIGLTAEALGISRKSLWERMKRLGIG
jgi:DNA-binding NtrC family response regulator